MMKLVMAMLAMSFGLFGGLTAYADVALRVVSYNVWGLPAPFLKKASRFVDLPKTAPLLQADILGFQETFTSKAKPLAEMAAYPYVAYGPRAMGLRISSGLLIVSKWPIVSTSTILYTNCAGTDCFARKGAVHARVRLPSGLEVDVFNTHLNSEGSDYLRLKQIEALRGFVSSKWDGKRPLVILGDFNALPESLSHQTMTKIHEWRDTHEEYVAANPDLSEIDRDGFSFDYRRNPNVPPKDGFGRIDYLMVKNTADVSMRTAKARLAFDAPVGSQFLSDHFGLLVDLAIAPAPAPKDQPWVGASFLGAMGFGGPSLLASP